MGNRYHSQRGPNSIAGISRRRSLRGMLDARDKSTADIRGVQWLHPQGTAGAIVQNISGGQSYYISNPTGKTFKEGTILPAGSFSGASKDFIITGPPAGPRGAQVGGGVRRQTYRNGTPQEVSTPNFIGVAWNGDWDAIAYYYIDGTPLSQIAQTAGVPEAASATSVALAGGRYVIVLSDRGTEDAYIYSWDLQENAVYFHQIAAGYIVEWTPAETGGFLYWVESEPNVRNEYPDFKQYFRLVKSNLDLTNVTVVSTIEASVALGVTGSGLGTALAALNTTAMVGCGVFGNQDGIYDRRVNFRFPLNGGAATSSYTTDFGNDIRADTLYGRGVPDSTGKSVLFSGGGSPGGVYNDLAMRAVEDSLSLTTTDLWPLADPFPTTATNLDWHTLHVYQDGVTGLLYLDGVAYIAPIVGSPGGAPITAAPSAPPGEYGIPLGFFPIE